MQYFSKFLPAVLDEPRYLVIGTGYMTASYPYLINGYTSEEFFPYDPESSGDIDQSTITDGMIIPDSDSRYLTEDDLKGFTAEELRIARNEIYARYGRKFNDSKLQEHFNSMEWYFPTTEPGDFDESILNDYEIKNLDLIAKYEKKVQ